MSSKKYIRLARDRDEIQLAKLGLPPEHWSHTLDQFSFLPVKHKQETRTPTAQFTECKALISNPRWGKLLVISSSPTDAGAIALGCWLLKHYRDMRRGGGFLNAAERDDDHFKKYGFVLIFNVLEKATQARIEQTRDLIFRHRTALRCVAVGGPSNPYEWCLKKLRIHPTSAFRVKDLEI